MLFNIFLQNKQMFLTSSLARGNVIDWACSEMRLLVAHPSDRGTNIALIILPQKGIGLYAEDLCLTIQTTAGSFYRIHRRSLKEHL